MGLEQYFKDSAKPEPQKTDAQVLDSAFKKLGVKGGLKTVQKGNQKDESLRPRGYGEARRVAAQKLPNIDPETAKLVESALYMNSRDSKGNAIGPDTAVADVRLYSVDPKTRDSVIAEFRENPEAARAKYSVQRQAFHDVRNKTLGGAHTPDLKSQTPGAFEQTGTLPNPLDPEQAQAEQLAPDFQGNREHAKDWAQKAARSGWTLPFKSVGELVSKATNPGGIEAVRAGVTREMEKRIGRALNEREMRDVEESVGGYLEQIGNVATSIVTGGATAAGATAGRLLADEPLNAYPYAGHALQTLLDPNATPEDRKAAILEGALSSVAGTHVGRSLLGKVASPVTKPLGNVVQRLLGRDTGVQVPEAGVQPAQGVESPVPVGLQVSDPVIPDNSQGVKEPSHLDRVEKLNQNPQPKDYPPQPDKSILSMTDDEFDAYRESVRQWEQDNTPENILGDRHGEWKKAHDEGTFNDQTNAESQLSDSELRRLYGYGNEGIASLDDLKDFQQARTAFVGMSPKEAGSLYASRLINPGKNTLFMRSLADWLGMDKAKATEFLDAAHAKLKADIGGDQADEFLKPYRDAVKASTTAEPSAVETPPVDAQANPDAPQTGAQPQETLVPPSGVVELNSGFNPFKELDYNITENPEGGFLKVEKADNNDWSTGDLYRSPLSVIDEVTGGTTRAGSLERRGGATGKSASRAISGAERRVSTQTALYEARVDRTLEALDSHAKENRLKSKRAYSDFIDLVEKPFNDPDRQAVLNSKTHLGEALREHDALTEDIRKYIVYSRKELGVETPDDWGITDKGYYRHMFFGNIEVKVKQPDGTMKLVGTAKTYSEAQKIAIDILRADPKAKILAKPRTFSFGDPTLRVSNRRYWRLVKDLAGETGLTEADIVDDIKGTVGRNASRRKFLGSLLHREGAEGFSRDYADVMRLTAAQAVRAQELSKLNKTLTPLIEKLVANGRPGTAEALKAHLDSLWGTPTAGEKAFGNTLRGIKFMGIGDRIAVPELAGRQLAGVLNAFQYNTKLRFSVKGGLINALQPMQTLLPFIKAQDFAKVYLKAIRPSTLKELAAKGVLDIGGKVEGTGGRLAKLDVFQPASRVNRAVGYVFGHDDAIARGASEEVAHAAGLEWAKRVEFDSSKWGVQPILRGPGGKVLGQFKGFTGKAFENMADVWRKGDEKNALERLGRIVKYHGTTALLGGAKAATSPATLASLALASKLYTEMRDQGASEEEATTATNGVLYGAPSLLGGDLSASLTLGDIYGGTPAEAIVNTLLGPTASTFASVWQLGKDLSNAEDGEQKTADEKRSTATDRFLGKLTPLWRQGKAVAAVAKGESPTYKKEGQNVEPDLPLAKFLMTLGIAPVEQSAHYDYKKGKD